MAILYNNIANEQSPCLTCGNINKDKEECSTNCKKLAEFKSQFCTVGMLMPEKIRKMKPLKDNIKLIKKTKRKKQEIRSDNKTGHVGISIRKNKTYLAQIRINRITKHIGVFSTIEEAIAARKITEKFYKVL